MAEPILQVSDLRFGYRGGEALQPALSFSVSSGEVIAITGANGSGKTTLLKTLLGLTPKISGTVRWGTAAETRVYLPQMGNVAFFIPLRLADLLPPATRMAHDLLADIDLARPWNTASGGERQRVLIARAVSAEARIVLLDEPFNHLDVVARERLLAWLSGRVDEGLSIILVSHEMKLRPLKINREIALARDHG